MTLHSECRANQHSDRGRIREFTDVPAAGRGGLPTGMCCSKMTTKATQIHNRSPTVREHNEYEKEELP
jgi:hypothetical protein